MKCGYITLFQAPSISVWFRRYSTPNKELPVVSEVVICGGSICWPGAEKAQCTRNDTDLKPGALLCLAPGPLHSHCLCQNTLPSFLPHSFTFFRSHFNNHRLGSFPQILAKHLPVCFLSSKSQINSLRKEYNELHMQFKVFMVATLKILNKGQMKLIFIIYFI